MGKGRPGQRKSKHARGETTADELERSFGMSAGTKLQTYLPKIRQYADAAGFSRDDIDFILEYYQPQLSQLVKEENEDDIEKNAIQLEVVLAGIQNKLGSLVEHVEKRRAEEDEKAEAPQVSAGGQQIVVIREQAPAQRPLPPGVVPTTPEELRKKAEELEAKKKAEEAAAAGAKLIQQADMKAIEEGRDAADSFFGQEEEGKKPEGKDFAAPKAKEIRDLEEKLGETQEKLKVADNAIIYAREQRDHAREDKKFLEDQVVVMSRDLEQSRVLTHSAYAHTEDGNLLLVERQRLRSAEKEDKKTHQVVSEDENGIIIKYKSVDMAKLAENDLIKKMNKAKEDRDKATNPKEKNKFSDKVIKLQATLSTLKKNIQSAEDCAVYDSVIGIAQNQETVAKLEYQYSKPTDDSMIEYEEIGGKQVKRMKKGFEGGQVKGAEALNSRPVQIFKSTIKSKIADIDQNLHRIYHGGLLARGVEIELGFAAKYIEDSKGKKIKVEDIPAKIMDQLDQIHDNEELKTRLKNATSEKVKLERRAENAEKKRDEALTEASDSSKELEKVTAERDDLTARADKNAKQIEQLIADNTKLTQDNINDREEYNKKAKAIQDELDTLKQSLEHKKKVGDQNRSQLIESIKGLEADLAARKIEYEANLAAKDDIIKKKEDKITELYATFRAQAQRYKLNVKSELDGLEAVCREVEAEVLEKIQELEGDLAQLNLESEEQKGEINELGEKVSELSAKIGSLNESFAKVRIYTNPAAEHTKGLVDYIRKRKNFKKALGLYISEENKEDLIKIVHSAVKREVKGCREDDIDFITHYHISRFAEIESKDRWIGFHQKQIISERERSAKAEATAVQLDAGYRDDLREERADREVEVKNKDSWISLHRAHLIEERERSAKAEATAVQLDAGYRNDLKEERERREAELENKDRWIKLHRTQLMDERERRAAAEGVSVDLDASYRTEAREERERKAAEMAAMSREFQVEMNERDVGANINIKGYERKLRAAEGRAAELDQRIRHVGDMILEQEAALQRELKNEKVGRSAAEGRAAKLGSELDDLKKKYSKLEASRDEYKKKADKAEKANKKLEEANASLDEKLKLTEKLAEEDVVNVIKEKRIGDFKRNYRTIKYLSDRFLAYARTEIERDQIKLIVEYDKEKLLTEEGVADLKKIVSNKDLDGLINQIAGYVNAENERNIIVEDLEKIKEKAELGDEKEVENLKENVHASLGYFVEIVGKYVSADKKLKEYEAMLKKLEGIDPKNPEGLDGLPPIILELIERAKAAAEKQPGQGMPGYGAPQWQGGFMHPGFMPCYCWGGGYSAPRGYIDLWTAKELMNLTDKVAELRARLRGRGVPFVDDNFVSAVKPDSTSTSSEYEGIKQKMDKLREKHGIAFDLS